MIGIGIDIVDVNRIKKWFFTKGLPERFFNQTELDATYKKGSVKLSSLAARFAAKEAFGKALGTGLKGIKLKDICVINNKFGKPELTVLGSALDAFNKNNGKKIHLSLSHEKHTAIAVVMIE